MRNNILASWYTWNVVELFPAIGLLHWNSQMSTIYRQITTCNPLGSSSILRWQTPHKYSDEHKHCPQEYIHSEPNHTLTYPNVCGLFSSYPAVIQPLPFNERIDIWDSVLREMFSSSGELSRLLFCGCLLHRSSGVTVGLTWAMINVRIKRSKWEHPRYEVKSIHWS